MANKGQLSPEPCYGEEIEGLPPKVKSAYDEVRSCMKVSALAAAEMVCRKILMNAAVEKGAPPGGSFTHYVDFLEQNGFTSPVMKDWVDQIRQHGNGANHEIAAPSLPRAESTVQFTIQLLRIVYELPAKAARFKPKPATP